MKKNDLKLNEQFSYVGDDFKTLLKDLCFEIDKIDTSFPFVVGLLSKMPYELAMVVVENLKYNSEVYRGTLNTIYYDEFKLGIQRGNDKKFDFKNRLMSQKSTDYITFIIDRLLTVAEIENLIKLLIEDEKLDMKMEDVLSGKETGDKKFKVLSKSHEFLSQKDNANTNQNIIKKLDRVWLKLTLKEIIEYKEKKKLGV